METYDERIVRLARQAREQGIRVYSHDAGKQWFASSASTPGTLHYITAVSCSSKGFIFSGACTHNAALLDRLGWLPRIAEELPATMPCLVCRGAGEVWSEGSWSPDRCFVCRGFGLLDVVADRLPAGNVIEFPITDDCRPAA